MRNVRPSLSLAILALLALSGCGYVHVGKLPEPTATVIGDDKLMKENADLRLEKKLLQQELALTRAQGDALKFAIENRTADGDTSKRLTEKLSETSRELATLRASYATLQAERAKAPAASPTEVADLKARLGATEEKLAASLKNYTELSQEITGLKTELEQKRTENVALAEQVKVANEKNAEVQAALAQLNTDLVAQRDARTKAEQDAATLRTQLDTANTRISTLAQQRTAPAPEAKSIAAGEAPAPAAATSGGDAELRTQLDTLRKKVWSLEAERSELQQQLAVAENKIKAPGEAEAKALADALAGAKMARQETETLKTANADLAKARTELENTIARLQATGSNAVTVIRDELAQTQAVVNQLTEENGRLKARLAAGGVNPPASAISAPPVRQPSSVNATLVTNSGAAPAAASVAVNRPPGAAPRYHTVSSGDTLARISILYYGNPGRWSDILSANRDVLGEDNNLVIGRTLRIP
ncbi:MAG: LysM peptidoglycan-binding domain-containing protein [Verrucomicrobia bacterium]|nr:LysM peptidoglycan-binding domain-containing protein [Verrucomicrobiota bacterium]